MLHFVQIRFLMEKKSYNNSALEHSVTAPRVKTNKEAVVESRGGFKQIPKEV